MTETDRIIASMTAQERMLFQKIGGVARSSVAPSSPEWYVEPPVVGQFETRRFFAGMAFERDVR